MVLLVYGGIASLILVLLSKGVAGLVPSILAFAVFILSGSAISSALQVIDKKTIATFRRVQALLLGGETLWILIAITGAAYAWSSGSPFPVTNALLFGAFVSAGFEFLVINGAFERNAPLSLVLSAIHPTSTLLIVRMSELSAHLDPVAALSGGIALVAFVAFPLMLRGQKTNLGFDALGLFQAFMKTWTSGRGDDLEGVIAAHSEEVEVTTKVLRFKTGSGNAFLVLPGVHPGPFHPIGSYDLPGVMSRAFKGLGPVMTLHRPGGHERNLATRADTQRYALAVADLAKTVAVSEAGAVVRGPIHAKVGNASVSASAFSDDMVMTVSFAPLGSDDIDTGAEAELVEPASELGLDISVVDAHNSIDPRLQFPLVADSGWSRLYQTVKGSNAERFSVAYSHSSEVGFDGRGDITENGIGLFLIQKGAAKSALVLADANNSVPTLREEVAKALGSAGYELIEFCTSDSHNLAARGLTVERGYEALGEVTPPAAIAELAVKMAKLADSRLAPAAYGSAKMQTRVRVFGAKALEEFAAITQSSSRVSKRYFKFTTVAVAVLWVASVFF
jgi:putative membrane protein